MRFVSLGPYHVCETGGEEDSGYAPEQERRPTVPSLVVCIVVQSEPLLTLSPFPPRPSCRSMDLPWSTMSL